MKRTRIRIAGIDLPTGKRVESTEKRKLIAAFDPIHFRVVRICVLPDENYRGRIFRSGAR